MLASVVVLRDVLVVDFTRYLPGPFASRELLQRGARVVRVETPEGDPLRTVAPGWGSFYPGPGYYPFGFPYGYAYPYAPRGSYGCYRPVPVQGPGKWNFVRERVC